jgi:hypothetical protein
MFGRSTATLIGFSGRKSVPNTAQFKTKPVTTRAQGSHTNLEVAVTEKWILNGGVPYEVDATAPAYIHCRFFWLLRSVE